MKKDVLQKRISAAFVGALLALLLLYPADAMDAVRAACRLWAGQVMPALFPYMVVSSLLVSRLGSRALTVPLSMLGGSPTGARLVAQAGFSQPTAQSLAALCATASPMYMLGTLSGGPRMLMAHWLGALIAYFCIRLLVRRQHTPAAEHTAQTAPSFSEIVRDSTLSVLTICGYMALFMALSALLCRAIPLPDALRTLLSCVLEMAGGCASIHALDLPQRAAMPLLCATVSFGGLSIFMQNAMFLRPAGVSMRLQLLSRLIHAGAAYGLCVLSYALF